MLGLAQVLGLVVWVQIPRSNDALRLRQVREAAVCLSAQIVIVQADVLVYLYRLDEELLCITKDW